MDLEIKPGTRFRSAVCSTEIIVVRGSGERPDLRCGGHPVLPFESESTTSAPLEPGFDEGTMVGKRYIDADGTFEVLCTKPGAGTLSIADLPMQLKDAKPLPASD